MEINWLGSLVTQLPTSSSVSEPSLPTSGATLTLPGDTLTLSREIRLQMAYGKGQDTGIVQNSDWWLDKLRQDGENAKSPVWIVQEAVSKTTDYLQGRLDDLIGRLNDGSFEGGLAKEMQALAQKMQEAQNQDDGARALALLREQSGKLAEALKPELEGVLDDTRQYFTQSLTMSFRSLRIIDPTGKSIGYDLLGLGENPDVDAETAASLLKEYDFIPESSKLNKYAAGEGVLYESQNDPTLKNLFESIQLSFSETLDDFFGNPDDLAENLDQGFMDQALGSFFMERHGGDPDMAEALGSGLESLLDRLSGDAGVKGLKESMDENVKEAVENFKPKKGYLTTVSAVADMDDQTETAAKILDALRATVAKDQAERKASEQEALDAQTTASIAETGVASVDILV